MARRLGIWTKVTRKTGRKDWGVEYKDRDGKRRFKSVGLQADAKVYEVELREQLKQGTHRTNPFTCGEAMTHFLDKFEEKVKNGTKRQTSLDTYRSTIELWLRPALGHVLMTPDDLPSHFIQHAIDGIAGKASKDKTRLKKSKGKGFRTLTKRAADYIDAVLNHAVKWKMAARNPLTDIPLEVAKLEPEVYKISRAELETFLGVVSVRQLGERASTSLTRRVAFLLILCAGGMRRQELSGLQWEDIDWIEGTIHIQRTYNPSTGLKKRTKTKAGDRIVPMVPQIRGALTELWELRGRPKTGYVLLTDQNTNVYQTIYQVLGRTLVTAGLVDAQGRPLFGIHALRHTYGALLIDKGVLPAEVARLMGHDDVTTTMRTYAYLLEDNLKGTAAIHEIAADLAPRVAAPLRLPMTRQEIDRRAKEKRKALRLLAAPVEDAEVVDETPVRQAIAK
jgi:integrase